MSKLVISFLIIFVAFSSSLYPAQQKREELYQEIEVFTEVLNLVNTQYVQEVTFKDLIYGALKGILSSLDPHSQFLSPEDYKELRVETEGEFGGLGIEITIREGLLTIVTPIEDTPAWEVGLKPEDIIVRIDNETTKDITLDEAVKKMRGKPGTEITITIFRPKEGIIKDITITRALIKVRDIKNTQIIDEGIGYIRIADFREKTSKQLDEALKSLEEQGLKGLILDLRNNPGGVLEAAIQVASRFVNTGSLIVYSQERDPEKVIRYYSRHNNPYVDIPMVVIVNKGSASASEIVAACLKDYGRAIILGQSTFGKGSIQTLLPLSDGSAIKLTTAYYYSPNGNVIQDKGVEPDILVADFFVKYPTTDDKVEEVFDKVDEETKSELLDDYEIMRAADLLKGVLVYKQ